MGTPIDREKLLSINVQSGGRTWRTKDQVRDFRRDDGVRCKATTDQLGNTVTLHNTGDTERQDVNIQAPTIHVTAGMREERT
jgi:hypothetical protein